MLTGRFLTGLTAHALESFPGMFAIDDTRKRNSYRYVASYHDGMRAKAAFFAFLSRHGQKEDPSRWHLHHVVEGHHFADIDFDGRLKDFYDTILPCVFIDEDEHSGYTRQARLRGTREMYRDALPGTMEDRSRAARKSAVASRTDVARLAALRARVMKMRRYYRDLHEGDFVIRRLADNVLLDAIERLNSIV
jgi:hypothetical protein